MIYQTLHTPPITPEELSRLETLLLKVEGVKINFIESYARKYIFICEPPQFR